MGPEPGDVVHFSDGQRTHCAFLLEIEVHEGNAWALFLTTNPLWSERSRQATDEELSFTGFSIDNTRTTYLVPVVRPIVDASPSGNSITPHRLGDLREEFGPSPFIRQIPNIPSRPSLPDLGKAPIREVHPKQPEMTLTGYFISLVSELAARVGEDNLPAVLTDKANGSFFLGIGFVRRSVLMNLVRVLPALQDLFFIRRSSLTLQCQAHWMKNAQILKAHRESLGFDIGQVASVMGLPVTDLESFENAKQCPSYKEMLTLANILPGLPDEFSLPSSVPWFVDVIFDTLRRRHMKFMSMLSATRMNSNRIDKIIAGSSIPTKQEILRLKSLFPNLPPYRRFDNALDMITDDADNRRSRRIGVAVTKNLKLEDSQS
jgi:hypothetical protein